MSEWISVKDRLPEKLNKVLVAHHNGITIAYYYNNSWVGKQGKKHYLSSVTHWMPLPERPEGE